MKTSMRSLMVAVAVVAIVLGVAIRLGKAYRREFQPSPAAWARANVASFAKMAATGGHLAERADPLAKKCEELAASFDRDGELWPWPESTYYGPFTDQLQSGQAVMIRQAAVAAPSDTQGRRRGAGEAWRVAPGLAVTVIRDWAGDVDDCDPFREILIRFVESPHQGELALVDRVYSRRKP